MTPSHSAATLKIIISSSQEIHLAAEGPNSVLLKGYTHKWEVGEKSIENSDEFAAIAKKAGELGKKLDKLNRE